MPKNRVLETMIRVSSTHFIVRVWRTIKAGSLDARTDDIRQIVQSFDQDSVAPTKENMYNLGCAIEELDDIAAIEVLDHNGNGILIYPDWY